MKRIKTLGILILSFASVSMGLAQSEENSYVRLQTEPSASLSNNIISFGFGMGGTYPYTGTSAIADPNIILHDENAIVKDFWMGYISLGGLASYKTIYSSYQDYNTGYNYEQRWNYYIFGARLAFHISPFNAKKNIEFYAGAMVAYYVTSFKFTSNDPYYSDPTDPGYSLTDNSSPNFFAPSIFAGVRSWISHHSAVWLEAGYGYTSMAFGISYKI